MWGGWELGSRQVGDSPQSQSETLQPHSCQMHQGCGRAPLLRAIPVPLEEARTVLGGPGRSTRSGEQRVETREGTESHCGRHQSCARTHNYEALTVVNRQKE